MNPVPVRCRHRPVHGVASYDFCTGTISGTLRFNGLALTTGSIAFISEGILRRRRPSTNVSRGARGSDRCLRLDYDELSLVNAFQSAQFSGQMLQRIGWTAQGD